LEFIVGIAWSSSHWDVIFVEKSVHRNILFVEKKGSIQIVLSLVLSFLKDETRFGVIAEINMF